MFKCAFEPRECNEVAHALAASVVRTCLEEDVPLLDVLPICIQLLVADDISANE